MNEVALRIEHVGHEVGHDGEIFLRSSREALFRVGAAKVDLLFRVKCWGARHAMGGRQRVRVCEGDA